MRPARGDAVDGVTAPGLEPDDDPFTDLAGVDVSTTTAGTARRFLRRPAGVIAAAYLLLVMGAVVLAPWIAPYEPDQQDLRNALSSPSRDHLLGAGELGRDVLSRLLYGGRTTLLSVLVAVLVFGVIGIIVGLCAGYLGGRVDRMILRVSDVVYATPGAIVLLVVIAIFPQQQLITMVALGLLGAPSMARVVRSVTRGVSAELYVSAARVAGLGPVNIMRRHVLPLLAGVIVVQLSLFAAAAISLETALGFLGLGQSGASWGASVAEASRYMGVVPWLLVPTGLNIVLFVIAVGIVGDRLRDSLTDALAGAPLGSSAGSLRPQPTDPFDSTPPATDRSSEPESTTGQTSPALLRVTDLRAGFDLGGAATTVVRDVSFSLRRGQALGVVGESGCGKSVTTASLLGLLPEGGQVWSGSIRYDGRAIEPGSADQRALRGSAIGWVSQHPVAGLDPTFTVGTQLVQVIRALGDDSRAEARRHAVDLLTRVRLDEPERVAKMFPHELSGGMAQRVALALALAGEPTLIIADEPTTSLDVTVQAEILDLLRDLVGDGASLVIITHDWGVLADVCDEALVMYAGEVVERGGAADLTTDPRHPYTAALLRASPHGVDRDAELPSIRGRVLPATAEPIGCRFAPRCDHAIDDCRVGSIPLSIVAHGREVRCIRAEELALGETS